MRDRIERATEWLKESEFAIALTGAGISVESGIPAFRGSQGLWDKYDPAEYATIEAFMSDPFKVWKMLKELYETVRRAEPNAAHRALAELEAMGKLRAVITQNVDSLHQRAGSRNVIEFHGSGETLTCLSCGGKFRIEDIDLENIPPLCHCGGILKPDVVFFGEPIPPEALKIAFELAERCDLLLVVGTSAQVYPAASIPRIARDSGARVVEINLEPTPLTHEVSHLFIEGKAGEILPEIVQLVKT